MLKPLDFVRPKGTVGGRWSSEQGKILEHRREVCTDNIGIITEITPPTQNMPWYQASVQWLDNRIDKNIGLFNAWWHEDDLIVVGSLPNVLANSLCHPFSSYKDHPNKVFPID